MFDITSGPIYKAQKVVLYGPEGIGKTTFAARFPDPVFIDTESGSSTYNVKRLPLPTSWTMLAEEIHDITANKRCHTLVIDTIDWAEKLCIAEVCAKYQMNGIEDFGYGKGYVYVYEAMGKMLNALTNTVETGINVVLLAHAMLTKMEQPEEQGSYDRYTLKLTNKTSARVSAMVKEWADMLLFANYETMLVTDSKTNKRYATGKKRVMYTSHSAVWDAKNRLDLPEKLPFDYAAIAQYIPAGDPVPEEKEKTEPKAAAPGPKPEKPATKSAEPARAQVAKHYKAGTSKLSVLMSEAGITTKQLQAVVGSKGYFPADMPVKDYPKDFVEGWVIPCWSKIVETIKKGGK